MAKLYVKAFGISCGIVAAALTLIVSTLSVLFFIESGLSRAMAVLYLGYSPTMFSIILNSIWGFAFAFCVGGSVALLYNKIIDESSKEIEDKIKEAARVIWESKGKPEGGSAENWKEAEKKVRGF
ncbi:MAG: DUF2934 domain-containing protein [Candidatus Omnitrophota bacterium]